MDIDEIKREKGKMEFLIRDSLNEFMRKTKMEVTNIDIGYTTLEPGTMLVQITNIELSLVL